MFDVPILDVIATLASLALLVIAVLFSIRRIRKTAVDAQFPNDSSTRQPHGHDAVNPAAPIPSTPQVSAFRAPQNGTAAAKRPPDEATYEWE